MLILKRRQRYFERFEESSTELYPLSEGETGNRDNVRCQDAQINLESDKVRLCGQTLTSCG